jgi:hypothetical protein
MVEAPQPRGDVKKWFLMQRCAFEKNSSEKVRVTEKRSDQVASYCQSALDINVFDV